MFSEKSEVPNIIEGEVNNGYNDYKNEDTGNVKSGFVNTDVPSSLSLSPKYNLC